MRPLEKLLVFLRYLLVDLRLLGYNIVMCTTNMKIEVNPAMQNWLSKIIGSRILIGIPNIRKLKTEKVSGRNIKKTVKTRKSSGVHSC